MKIFGIEIKICDKTPGIYIQKGDELITLYHRDADGIVLGYYKDVQTSKACDLALSLKDGKLTYQNGDCIRVL